MTNLYPIQDQELSEIIEPKIGNGKISHQGLAWHRLFGQSDPYDSINWEIRTAKITKGNGEVVFEQKDVEAPDFWTQTATDIVASKYFRGRMDSPDREYSARQMVDRVANTISAWGYKDGYFKTHDDYLNFSQDLKFLLINQYAAFNSPVWFNVGVREHPQCSACQPYHALISTPKGMVPIGEIVFGNLIGHKVYDANGTTKVTAVKYNGKKKVYRVTLANGTFVEATEDHLVKAVYQRRTEPNWVRIDQLRLGMKMHLHPHRDGFSPISETNCLISEAALAGWLQADGFVGQYKYGTNRSLTLEFETVNKAEREWVYSHLTGVFPNVHSHERAIPMQNPDLDYRRIRLYGKVLEKFVHKYDLLKPWQEKRVPKELFTASRPIVASYLKSVFQADGYVGGKNTSIRVGLAIINPLWAEDIQLLLLRCGIYSRRYVKRESRPDRQDMNVVEISIGSEREKFFNLIGFVDERKQKKLGDSLEIKVKKNCPDLREETIVAIENVGVQKVYDIQTESGEYLSNNIAVHNCFILAVEDNMQSILDWYRDEGWIFKYGSGSGTNLSKLRSSKEALSLGGKSSGPVSFMKGADGVANSIRSGGTTRRAAKMVVLDVGHPDIKDFIYCKKIIEDMTKVLETSGIKASIEGELFNPYTLLPYQNANNSVRVTDDFMKRVEADENWELKAVTTGKTLETLKAREAMDWITDAAWHSADPGMQFDTTINDWHTCPNSGRINASNPCSEYMHLDNSACNLASLNLLRFLQANGTFDIELFKKAVDTILTAQEVIVGNSSYPTEKITHNALDFRELGLGYANLGSLLMNMGLAYDSDAGRAMAGAITSIMCGQAYSMSAKLASVKGPFAGYELNKEPMLRIMRKHALASENLANVFDSLNSINLFSNYDSLGQNALIKEAVVVWREAIDLGEKFGFRNSQATVLAPTGTIAFLMDCDTTGIEPELALVKYKKLVGGGTLKLVNSQVPPALRKLGYEDQQISDISAYLLEKETIEGAPHLQPDHLSIFDCSFKATNGARSISYLGHIKMMGAVQPFISGAISKTVNLPNEATKEDIRDAFMQSWKHGLKAVAVYRDGCKSMQPLNTSADKKSEISGAQTTNANLVEKINGYTRIKLPDERPSITHKFSIGNHEGYLTVGLYPESKKPGETFITIAKEGSTISGLFDVIATLTSMCLQSGVPLKTLVKKFKDLRFEPSGITSSAEIPFAKSFIDYIFKYMGYRFLSDNDREEIFGTPHVELATPFNEKESLPEVSEAIAPVQSSALEAMAVSWDNEKDAHTDAPVCECGTMMFKAGSCYTCPNCFNTTGVCN